MDIFKDISSEIQLFFTGLNWTYIFIFIMVLYGIKYKPEFHWYNSLLNKLGASKFKVWIAGIVIGIIFCIFRHLDGIQPLNSLYVSSLMRSWIVAIVFNSMASLKIQQIDKSEDPKKD